eukprot:scaffold105814_cov64-Cyclotella_meneghiniana.AAC.1
MKSEQGGDVRMQREWEVRRSWGKSVRAKDSRLAWMDRVPRLVRDEPRQGMSSEMDDDEESWVSEWDMTDSEDESDSDEEWESVGAMEGTANGTAPGEKTEGVLGAGEGTTYGTVLGENYSEEAESLDEGETDGATMRLPIQPLHEGLRPPELSTGERVSGHNKRQLRRENKRKRINKQLQQQQKSYWTSYKGEFDLPEELEEADVWLNQMCPQRLALRHPAAAKLLQYATGGCPCKTGKDWTKEQIWEAVERGPHVSALDPKAIEQLKGEIAGKVKEGQCKVVLWDDVKHDPPKQMKVSPLAMIPHKSRGFRAILDLSFKLRLKKGGMLPSVNEGTTLEAPAGAIDQLVHSLSRIIHAFAEAEEDAKIFLAKFDIKDGFWRLSCETGEEWNFCYVLPQEEGEPTRLVVPTSLQMGWVESPPYFCAASETARDVATQYVETKVGSLQGHKFEKYTMENEAVKNLPVQGDNDDLRYFVDVYVDDFIPMAIATSQEQLRHVANAVMQGIHDVFPACEIDENDPISLKKLKKLEGEWALVKDVLGFTFDGLLSPCNKLLRKRPVVVWLGKNRELRTALENCRVLLREASLEPTPCRELVMGEPDYIGVKDASIHGVGGFIVGENAQCVPTVFRMEWPEDIREEVRRTNSGRGGKPTNSDLEMAGLLLLFLVMEEVCKFKPGQHVALFSDNSPTVSW